MRIEKTVLGAMPMPYAVGEYKTGDAAGVIFASEDRNGPCRLYSGNADNAETRWNHPGGVMNIVQDGDNPAVWAIQKFFPVFQSAGAEVLRVERDAAGVWRQTETVPLPYVHRIARFEAGGKPYLLACTLCSHKDFEQDWSHPGSVYAAALIPGQTPAFRAVADGLVKNHGLSFIEGAERPTVLVSSAEGVLRIEFLGDGDLSWRAERIHDREASEAVLFDIDGDGARELITIEGFHGDHLRIHKATGSGWEGQKDIPIVFGHVLWAGTIGGKRCILAAGRGAEKDTILYFPPDDIRKEWRTFQVDSGVGATQIAVVNGTHETLLYAANHGVDEVVRYRLSE